MFYAEFDADKYLASSFDLSRWNVGKVKDMSFSECTHMIPHTPAQLAGRMACAASHAQIAQGRFDCERREQVSAPTTQARILSVRTESS